MSVQEEEQPINDELRVDEAIAVSDDEQAESTVVVQENVPEHKLTPKQVLDYLVEKFPNCFVKEGEAKPLKIGIFQDLTERLEEDSNVSKTQLRGVLRHYTQSWRYLHSIKVGAKRVDLDGNEGEELEQQHVDHAQQQLAESKQKFAEQRKAQNALNRDKIAKKPKSSNDQNDKKKPKRDSRYKSKATNKGHNKAKSKDAATINKQPVKELQNVSDEQLKAGQAVQVKVGNNPVPGTVSEIAKDGVFVQLTSGMVVKVQSENIFIEK